MKFKLFLLSFLILFCGAVVAQNSIKFTFTCNGNALQLNKMIYKSKRGLTYQVCQCQYFVSDIKVVYHNKTVTTIANSVHYVDAELPKTLTWTPSANFNLQNADSIVFTFGLSAAQNKSYRFKNPPENQMFWPDYLGGGYHYIKTNILYLDAQGNTNAFNCHIGRGQLYDSDFEPIGFIDNAFTVSLPVKLVNNQVIINLDVSTIFDYPTAVLFTDYGGIMNNQAAMKLFCRNIKAAFKGSSKN